MTDKCSKCRKFGSKLFLKGARCLSPKCAITRRNYKPGDKGAKGKLVRKSEYGLQLMEKQKAKAEYGLREKQFAKIFENATASKTATGEQLLRLLEARIDNTIYRLGWASSRAQARQLVLHNKINLNGKRVNIPSITLKPKDILTPVKPEVLDPIKTTIPGWLKQEGKYLKAEVVKMPSQEEVESDLDSQLIIEFYSR